MPALLGAFIILILLALVLGSRASPLTALILVPVGCALVAGHGWQTFAYAATGVASMAPTVALFVFAILFFGVLADAGLMEPLIAWAIRCVGGRPAWLVPASALLALLVHLDGSGAVCFLVVVPAMLPLFDRLGMDRRVLACAVSMAAGVNFLPWTGPMVRASSAIGVPALEIFRPMVIMQAVGLLFVFASCFWMGKREERRLRASGALAVAAAVGTAPVASAGRAIGLAARARLAFNASLALVAMGVLVWGKVPPAVVFLVATAIALVANFRGQAEQRARVEAHARAAIGMASILMAAGVFTGILAGTGALKGLALAMAGVVPAAWGHQIPLLLALVAMPLSMLFDPDSFYYGVLPVLAQVYHQFGGDPVHVAQAALVGQMTAGFPVSPLTPATFLVSGLSGIELAAHQRFSFPWLYAASLCMAVAGLAFGVLSS